MTLASPSDHESIRNTIALYCIALDQKDWKLLEETFTPDAKFEYPEPLGCFQGVSALQEKVASKIDNLLTQHALTTQRITLVSDKSALAVTYVTGSHFGTGVNEHKGFTILASYEDELVKDEFDGIQGWRIISRKVIGQGRVTGDTSLLFG